MRIAFGRHPVVFALRLDTAMFARCLIVFFKIYERKPQILRQKKPDVVFLCEGLSPIFNLRQPLFSEPMAS